ncbi:MAG: hypothetical protein ACYTBS_15620 [Planctomycetota bacterium]
MKAEKFGDHFAHNFIRDRVRLKQVALPAIAGQASSARCKHVEQLVDVTTLRA